MKTGKRYDDYLPGETRARYIERRKIIPICTLAFYWPFNKTLAKPGTREYERLKISPQFIKHIEEIDKRFPVAKC